MSTSLEINGYVGYDANTEKALNNVPEEVKNVFEECMAMIERRAKIYKKAAELIRITGNMNAIMGDELAVLEQVFDDIETKHKSKLYAIDTIYQIGLMNGIRSERARRKNKRTH